MVDTEDCLEQCEGTIADVVRLSDVKNEDGLQSLLQDYEIFKFSDLENLKYPKAGPSNFDFKVRSRLKYVLISFSTSTFDRIKKVKTHYNLNFSIFQYLQDRAAKFVDQLSAIGGTMGLLTGFSLISGVKIVYFMGKIILKMMKRTKLNKSFII